MISFDNTEIAFSGKSSKDLRRAYWLFKIVANPTIVKFGKWVTPIALKMYLPIKGLIKKTIFRQFCGGESIQESLLTSKELAQFNIKTILDYSIEGKTSEEDFDKTVNEIIATIREGKNNKNIPFAVFKVTGICRFDLLEKSNKSIDGLSEENKVDYSKLIERIDQICKAAFDCSVPVFIDGEESWIQDGIDLIAQQMSTKYNTQKAIVFNTIQMYRHDRLVFFKNEINHAKEHNYILGVKIVRGAYMEKERNRAENLGYPSPIQVNKAASDKDYNLALELSVDNIENVSICAGTHNEESSLFLTELLGKNNLSKDDDRLYFAQLLGMSDHISFNLAHHGYLVAKYVPYGPINEVLPYLLRRADENTSTAGQTSRELSLIIKEKERRKRS
ncbi:MAG: proline dehydrogenase family protein [Crocinitomicaceae bacterium]